MVTHLFLELGLNRDHVIFLWGKILSIATLVTTGVFDVGQWLAYLDLPHSPTVVHWIMALAVVVLYLSGQYSTSNLPAGPIKVGPSTLDNIARSAPMILLACMLGAGAMTACGSNGYHIAVTADVSLSQAIFALQDAEIASHNARVITDAKHVQYKAAILKLLQAGDDLTVALSHWAPGTPAPTSIAQAYGDVSALLNDVKGVVPSADPLIAKVQGVLDLLQKFGVMPSELPAESFPKLRFLGASRLDKTSRYEWTADRVWQLRGGLSPIRILAWADDDEQAVIWKRIAAGEPQFIAFDRGGVEYQRILVTDQGRNPDVAFPSVARKLLRGRREEQPDVRRGFHSAILHLEASNG